MNANQATDAGSRLLMAVRQGSRKSVGTIWFLVRIMVPVSLAVAVLGWSGILARVSEFMKPLMSILGLPGQASLAYLSGALLNNYSAIAVMGSLSLTLREATIIAVMCLLSHNLIVETAVMKKAGSSAVKMVLLRVGSALFAAWVLNLLLPRSLSAIPFAHVAALQRTGFFPMLGGWALSTGKLLLKIFVIVFAIMIGQRLFEEFRIMDRLSRVLSPVMRVFGLSRESSFLWIVINIVGYAYGAGIIVAEYESGRMKKQDGDLFNHHAAVSHSLMEDTIIFSAVSIPVLWLLVPRIVLSVCVVWLERLRRHFFRRSFRVGTV